MIILEYPKCSTCKKALNWLDSHSIQYHKRNIVSENPTIEELTTWIKQSKLPIKKFFNTSGNLYKEKNLKEILPTLSEKEQIELLSQNGMLVKRPLIIHEQNILVGFKPGEWQKIFDK